MPYIPRKVRRAVIARDGDACRYCGARGVRLTIDHVVPLNLNGPTTPENLVRACAPCNSGKGPIPIDHDLPTYALRVATDRESTHRCRYHNQPGAQVSGWIGYDENERPVVARPFTLTHCGHRGCPPVRVYADGMSGSAMVADLALCDASVRAKSPKSWPVVVPE